ncbi:MAG: NAD(P)H-hydrate dehydratase [Gammaproteobacteria bacterium]|nr:NAD(P)H-hydrate dehydratase [Gammaproteobacteria bacterium]
MTATDPLYSIEQIKSIEKAAITEETTALDLMVHAGTAAYKTLHKLWPAAKKIVVFAGHGNNGGDGYILAKLAQHAGLDVTVYSIGDTAQLREPAAWAWHNCFHAGVPVIPYTPTISFEADIVVDALLGIGIEGSVREPYLSAINTINHCGKPILALDIPSGLNADTGLHTGVVVHATATETFIGLKPGLFTAEGPDVAGQVFHDGLGIPKEKLADITPHYEKISALDFGPFLPRRSRSSHKGDFGHVLVIGGDCGMAGAVRMAAEAAARTGAGLVSIATRPDHADSIAAVRPELMCHGINKAKELRPLLEKASVIIIGPGLGRQSWGESMWEAVEESQLPLVIDADALFFLAKRPQHQLNRIITPHPGEAARLLGVDSSAIQNDRFSAIKKLQERFGGITVLKGAGTLISDSIRPVAICSMGNPGMSSGGMGDVLSGVIGGLIAQGLGLAEAARLGVLLHSTAADRVAQDGGERGLLAMDVVKKLRSVLNGLTRNGCCK